MKSVYLRYLFSVSEDAQSTLILAAASFGDLKAFCGELGANIFLPHSPKPEKRPGEVEGLSSRSSREGRAGE